MFMKNRQHLFYQSRLTAIEAHGAQKYGEHPYEYHLHAVVETLQKFGLNIENEDDAALLIAAWLHDSLEDTSLGKDTIASEFGAEIANLVYLVTDEPGRNRKERKAATYQKIKQSEKAITLKLADRIANVEESAKRNKGLFQMYLKEQQSFVENLRSHTNSDRALRMWNYLDELFVKGKIPSL